MFVLAHGNAPRGPSFLACSQWSPFAGDGRRRSKPFEKDIKTPRMIFDHTTKPSPFWFEDTLPASYIFVEVIVVTNN